MLSKQMLEQILIDSQIAQEFFQAAHSGMFFDNWTHDLFYDHQQDKLLARIGMDNQHQYEPPQQLICRIQADDPTQYIWPEIDYKQFVSHCLHEFEQYLNLPNLEHSEIALDKNQKSEQQQLEIHRHKDSELEL